LKDKTGEAYIFGLVDGRSGSQESFPKMQIAPGDTLTVSGHRYVYGGHTVELIDGRLLRKADGPSHAAQLEKTTPPEQWPTFKGSGPEAFSAWVSAHLKYPKDAKRAGIAGTVRVEFTIGPDGYIQEAKVVQGIFPSLDAEAVRVIKSSPKWNPGIKNGKPCRVTYTLPVIFSLN